MSATSESKKVHKIRRLRKLLESEKQISKESGTERILFKKVDFGYPYSLGTNIFEKVSYRHDAIKSLAAWFYSCFPFYLFEGARSQREIQIGRRAEDVLARVHLIMHYTKNRQNSLCKRIQKHLETNSVSSGSQFGPFNPNSCYDTVQFGNSEPMSVPRLNMLRLTVWLFEGAR